MVFARGKDPKQIPISLISERQANEVFRAFQQSEIPFKFTQSGCESRAMAMTRLASSQFGLELGHIYAEGDLWAKSPEVGKPDKWSYHTAAFAWVKTPKGKRAMVFDPSLFSKPVTIEEWKKRIEFKPSPKVNFRGEVTSWYFGSRFQLSPRSDTVTTKMKYDPQDLAIMATRNQLDRKYVRNPDTLPREQRRQPFSAQSIE